MDKGLSRRKFIIIAGAAALVILGTGLIGVAQISKERAVRELSAEYGDGAVVMVKKLAGEVVGFSPRNNPKYIGVAFDNENTDYYFTLDDNLQMVNRGRLDQIEIGDTVEVTFHKIVRQTEDGGEEREHRAKIVRFIRPKRTGGALISR